MTLLLFSLILAATTFVQFSLADDIAGAVVCDTFKSERDLRKDLFRDYDKDVRPVKKWATAVRVQFNMLPLMIRSMNEKEQLISMDTWIKMRWTDEFLQWDPSEYDNITELHIAPTKVWKPDIAVFTASPDTSAFPTVHTKVVVGNDGKVLWVPPYTVNSRCQIPFRTHAGSQRVFVECKIRIGSWTHSTKTLDLQLSDDKVDLENFQDYNYEWKLVKIVSKRESTFYACCPEGYPHVDFNITLKKRNSYLNHGSDN